ncbi:sulfotransferase [Candidatus Kaiserbacteria bacterium]|nr:MAG: sulfotransferase [Candidatus Kaiserbacteria bacterium]
MIDFIGIGAQRSGTSWVYACLYEHPEICIPIKEIHFFSRPRYEKGIAWYENNFAKCDAGKKCGEFSTSYLYSDITATRIHEHYPDIKIIAILRNPIDRALSQYGNAIKGGEIPESMPFTEYYTTEKSVLEQGLYAKQLAPYYEHFDPSQMLVLIYEDNKNDPEAFIKKIYAFLGVSTDFVPSMLHESINVTRVPKNIALEKNMHLFSEFLRKSGLDRLVHIIRRLGIPDLVRRFNTKPPKKEEEPTFDRTGLATYFRDDAMQLSNILGRDLVTEWGLHE